jgi:pyruvate dehydrogenase E2 component (dihydrolipoamide acetyltransferase)
MAKDIVMPKMGYDMTEGKLLRWIKHEGDTINKGEAIAEIETDKVNIEVEAFDSGVLQRVLVQEGETVPVGQPIGILATPGEGPAAEQKPETTAPTAAAPTGSQPPEEQPAAGGGTIKQEPPSTARATAPERPQAQASAAPGNGHAPAAVATQTRQGGRIKASPLARRLAQEYELDLSAIRGTGPGGRVTRDDVRAAVEAARMAAPTPQLAPAPAPEAVPEAVPTAAAAAGEKPLSRLQQTMARRMVESKTQAPHFYLTIHVDMTAALALRQQLNAQAEEGQKISVNDLIVKAAARALTKFPTLNASYAGDKLTLHDEINVAVAVAIDEGLVTPVVRHADQKSLGQIARETKALAERARGGKARLEDYEGGTFTVSNLGMYDVDTFVAIINPPQAAILAIGAVRRVPVYEGDNLVPRERMSVTLSADHRVTDGATGARFLAEVRGYLENPLRLVM